MTYKESLAKSLELLDADLDTLLTDLKDDPVSAKLVTEYRATIQKISQNFLNNFRNNSVAPKHEEFAELAISKSGDLAQTLIKKNHDYGDSFHKLFLRRGMVVADIHISEKYERLISLLNSDAKVNESIEDTLQDLAGYCILTLIEREKQKKSLS